MAATTSKRWFLGTVAAFLVLVLSAFFVVNILIDPTGERRWIETDFNRNKYVGGSLWHLIRKLSEKQYTLFFGSSRVHVFSSEIMGEPVLNFSALYRNPADIYTFLSLLSPQEVQNIKSVYVVLDFDGLFYEHRLRDFNSRFDLYWNEVTNLNFTKAKWAYECVVKNIHKSQENVIDMNGNVIVKNSKYLKTRAGIDTRLCYASEYSLEYLKKIENFCHGNKIKINFITYTTPEDTSAYKQSIAFLCNRLLSYIQGFYYLLELPELKSRRDLFTDETHLNTEGAKVVARYLKQPPTTLYIDRKYNPFISDGTDTPDIYKIKTSFSRQDIDNNKILLLLLAEANNNHSNPIDLVKQLCKRIDRNYYGYVIFELIAAKRYSWIKHLPLIEGISNYSLRTENYPSTLEAEQSTLCELHNLSLRQAKNLLCFLTPNTDVNTTCLNGNSPLHNSVLFNNYELTHLLIKAGADVNRFSYAGVPPLGLALANHNDEISELIHSYRKNATLTDINGYSAMHYFSSIGDSKALELMARLFIH